MLDTLTKLSHIEMVISRLWRKREYLEISANLQQIAINYLIIWYIFIIFRPIDTSGSSDSPNYDGERRRRSYSSYKDYATDILQSSRQSLGNVSGTYELYDTSPIRYGTQSQNSSFMSEDLESLADSVQSENIHTYSQGYENKFKTTRPVRSTDLKSKVFLRKKLHL